MTRLISHLRGAGLGPLSSGFVVLIVAILCGTAPRPVVAAIVATTMTLLMALLCHERPVFTAAIATVGALGALLLWIGHAHATTSPPEPWDGLARQCAQAVIKQRPGCASCSGLWPEWSECTARNYFHGARTMPQIKACITAVDKADREQPLSYDRTDDVMRCLRGAR
jgi:hypothetical protein